LSSVRTDDLGAIPISALIERNPTLDPAAVDDLVYGCANQAGEDNRNVARMSGLLAGLPVSVPAATVNRLCGSGMNAVGNAAHAIQCGQAGIAIAGGVESMSRAPFVLAKSTAAFGRNAEIYDTTLGWRFVNRKLEEQYGVDSMAETAENVADDFGVSREDQDRFALASQQKAAEAMAAGRLAEEIVAVPVPQRKGDPVAFDTDEHPRADSSIEGLTKLRPIVRPDGTVTAGNASGINDGACALLLASGDAAAGAGLEPMARVVAWAAAGVEPRVMGIGPVPASRKVLALAGLSWSRWTSSSSTRPSPPRDWPYCANSALPTTTSVSIQTAVRLRSAIRWACRARDWSRPPPTSSGGRAAVTHCARCASAWARVSRWYSSAHDRGPARWRVAEPGGHR
jgi:acetyl-CoA acyltransferase